MNDQQDQLVDPTEEYRYQVRRWKMVWAVTFLSLVLSMAGGSYGILRMIDLGKDTNRSVEILEKATGPESQEAQAQVVQNLVITIDCNNREAIQELIDQLPDTEGITVITPECEETG